MSVADRDYWKEPESSSFSSLPRWPVTYWLIAALVGAFALQCIVDVYGPKTILQWLALTPEAAKSGWIWQLITFQFLHGSFTHLLFNVLGLYWFGTSVERILGPKRYLIAYFSAGVVGGCLQLLMMLVLPGLQGTSVVGASAGIEGLFALFCLTHPTAIINVMMVLPVPARVLFFITLALELFFTLVPSRLDSGTAHAAHLGGLLFGSLWVRWGWHHEWTMLPGAALVDRIKNIFYRPRRPAPLKVIKGDAPRVRPSPPPPEVDSEDLAPEEFIAREVDPILDKIAAHGMASLTERERRILNAARDKVAKR